MPLRYLNAGIMQALFSVCVYAQVSYIGGMALESGDFRTPGQLVDALLKDRGWT